MQLDELYTFSNKLSDQGVLLCFNGPFSHGIIEQLGHALRRHVQESGGAGPTVMDVFGVFVEQTQNIQSYVSRELDGLEGASFGVVAIIKEGSRYVVQSGNRIRDEHTRPLLGRLDALARADAAALKAMYKQQLRAQIGPGESAGLGLIAMARAASEPLSYRIDPGRDGCSFFTLRVTV